MMAGRCRTETYGDGGPCSQKAMRRAAGHDSLSAAHMGSRRSRRYLWQGLLGALFLILAWASAGQAQGAKDVYSIQVDGLACPFCAYGIEKRLRTVDGVLAVEIDIGSGRVTVIMHEGARLDEETARRAVRSAGFTMRDFRREGAAE